MRAYGSRSFLATRRSGKPWKWFFIILVLGFVGGFVTATAWSVRQPVELVISTPSRQDFPLENLGGQAPPEVWSESGNISVRTPKANTMVASPLVVEGLERTFEQNVVVRLKDGTDNELAKVATTGTAPDIGIHGPYRAELTFEKPKTRSGTLEVFQISPTDAAEIDKVAVPIRFE